MNCSDCKYYSHKIDEFVLPRGHNYCSLTEREVSSSEPSCNEFQERTMGGYDYGKEL